MQDFHPVSSSLGRRGSTYITDTNAHTGTFGCIQALAATVIATLVSGTDHAGSAVMSGTLTNVPLPAGVSIYGSFTSITLTSGTVVAYNL